MKDKNIKSELTVSIISVVTVIVVIAGFTFGLFGKSMGFFSDTQEGSTNVIQFGDIGMTFCDNGNCASGLSNVNNSLNINTSSTPLSETEALSTTPYRFTLTNTGTLPLTVKIILDTIITANSSTISESELKNNVYVAIQEQGVGDPLVTLLTDLEDNILGSTTLGSNEAKTYELWTWVREDAPNSVQGAAITTSVRVQGEYIPYSNLPEVTAAVIFDKQGGTGGSDRALATYGLAMPTATAPTKGNCYTFAGYYSEPNGKGTKYYDEEMNSVRASNFINEKRLYAKWAPVYKTIEDSWATIVSNVQSGNTSNYCVGDTKEVTLGNDLGPHIIRISNKGDDDPADCTTNENYSQTACGFVLEFEDTISYHVMNEALPVSNAGGWPALSTEGGAINGMRDYVNTTIYNALPIDLKNGIIDTRVISGHGSTDTSNFKSTDKLYLLSYLEIYGESCSNKDALTTSETKQLKYYIDLGTTCTNYNNIGKKLNGMPSYWWLRSAPFDSSRHFLTVATYGLPSGNTSQYEGGVSPAFRIG